MSDVPFDDGNCFACGPSNPIGMHLHFDRAGGGEGVLGASPFRRNIKVGVESPTAAS